MKLNLLFLALLSLLVSSPARAQGNSDAEQQKKDLEEKQQIYGVKYPWQNTMPYGTQYVPPQSGAGTVDGASPEKGTVKDTHSAASKKAAQKHSHPASATIKKPVAAKPVSKKSESKPNPGNNN
jgi:hypothetical protein